MCLNVSEVLGLNAAKLQVQTLVQDQKITHYIYGYEVGEQGTPHIQGYVKFKNQVRFSTMKNKLPRAHIEKARGDPDSNYRYCSKDGDFQANFTPKLTREDIKNMVAKEYENVTWRDWQQNVIDIVDECKSARAIHWIWEPTGNVGKTFIAKFFALRTGTIICQGKSSDIFNQVNSAIDAGLLPKLILVDIPRVTLEYVSYNSIECLKNGLLYSGKYEGGICIFPAPTVVCFANERPDTKKLSQDRWRIYKIQNGSLFLTPCL